jgi:hypothetical protein
MPDNPQVRDLVRFLNEWADVYVDGERLERPATQWSGASLERARRRQRQRARAVRDRISAGRAGVGRTIMGSGSARSWRATWG